VVRWRTEDMLEHKVTEAVAPKPRVEGLEGRALLYILGVFGGLMVLAVAVWDSLFCGGCVRTDIFAVYIYLCQTGLDSINRAPCRSAPPTKLLGSKEEHRTTQSASAARASRPSACATSRRSRDLLIMTVVILDARDFCEPSMFVCTGWLTGLQALPLRVRRAATRLSHVI
jgi:hypothetical protein